MLPNELRNHLRLRNLDEDTDRRMMLGALASVSALIGEEKIEGHASWLDDLMSGGGKADGVHIRVILASGVVTVDYDFSFDGYADAVFIPWSRVHALKVIAEPKRQVEISNAWLESADGRIEFAGAEHDLFDELVRAVRLHLR